MENDHLKWLRGPLPPLSESILSSGLVNDPSLAPPHTHLQQAVFGSNSPSIQKPKKKPKPQHVEKPPTKRSESKISMPPPPVIPPADVPAKYKPQPIEQIAESPIKPPKQLKIEAPLLTETKKSIGRSDIVNLTHQLDSSIAEIASIQVGEITPEQQASIKTRLIQLYNYTFNQIILQEKDVCVDKALLLRRIRNFYNQIIPDIPSISQEYEIHIQQLQTINDSLNQDISVAHAKINEDEAKIKELLEKEPTYQEKIEKLSQESQQKDITVQTLSDERDMLKGQLAHSNQEAEILKEQVAGLKKAIEHRDDEITKQLQTIEENSSLIRQFQQGETGYIVVYHDEIKKREEAEAKIVELEKHIYELTHIEKFDKNVDTSDIPKASKKKKKQPTRESSQISKEPSLELPTEIPSQISINSRTRKSSKPSANISPSTSQNEFATPQVSFSVAKPQLTDSEVQVESTSSKLEVQDVSPMIPEFKPQSVFNEIKPSEKNVDICDSIATRKYCSPTGYNLDHEALFKAVPDLVQVMLPIFGQQYVPGECKEPEIVNLGKCASKPNDKPLVWGLQLINNFLTDPFIRSVQNENTSSIEQIFVEWLMRQYSLRHLVNQVIADISMIICKYKGEDKLIMFFSEIIESRYSHVQLCFIATIYSFTITMTFPNYLQMLQNMSIKPNFGFIQIHIQCAYKVLSNCLSATFASEFLEGRATEENPMIDFVDLLRQSAYFFGDKHRRLRLQAINLMKLSGAADIKMITYQDFCYFISLLVNSYDLKREWKHILNRHEDKTKEVIEMSDVISFCAEKKKPMLNLLQLKPLDSSIALILNMPPHVNDFYRFFIRGYSRVVNSVLKSLIPPIRSKVKPALKQVRMSLINVSFSNILWNYRILLSKIDYLTMKEEGTIPFPEEPTQQYLNQLTEYYKRAESIAFAFIDE